MNPMWGQPQAQAAIRLDKRWGGYEYKAYKAVLDAARTSEVGISMAEVHLICEKHCLSMSDHVNRNNVTILLGQFCAEVTGAASHADMRWKLAAFYSDGTYMSPEGDRVMSKGKIE